MGDFLRRYPLATLIGWATSVLALLVALQAAGYLTGQAAQWVGVAAGVLQVILTWWAKSKVTPVVDPRDNEGRQLVPAKPQPFRSGGSI